MTEPRMLSITEFAEEIGVSNTVARNLCAGETCSAPCEHCTAVPMPEGYTARKIGKTWVITTTLPAPYFR